MFVQICSVIHHVNVGAFKRVLGSNTSKINALRLLMVMPENVENAKES